MKLLLWAVIIFVAVMWLLHIKKSSIQRDDGDPANQPKTNDASEAIIRCAQCGIYVPASESISAQSDLAFCSEEHRLRYGRN